VGGHLDSAQAESSGRFNTSAVRHGMARSQMHSAVRHSAAPTTILLAACSLRLLSAVSRVMVRDRAGPVSRNVSPVPQCAASWYMHVRCGAQYSLVTWFQRLLAEMCRGADAQRSEMRSIGSGWPGSATRPCGTRRSIAAVGCPATRTIPARL